MAETLAGEDVAAPRAVLMAMKAREAEIGRIDRDLAAVDQAPGAPTSEAIAKRVDAALADWRGVLRRHPTLARQLLRKIVQGPLVVTPEALHEQPGYRVRGRASVEPLLTVELQRAGVGLHSKIVMDVHRLWRPQFARVGTRSSPGSSESRPFDRSPECSPVVAESPTVTAWKCTSRPKRPKH